MAIALCSKEPFIRCGDGAAAAALSPERLRGHLSLGARGVRLAYQMPTFGQRESADAIRERIGSGARYSPFVPPRVSDARSRSLSQRVGRVLWITSLVLFVGVVILAVLVAVGL
jgi:hypothetical protein